MPVRAKFRCTSIIDTKFNAGNSAVRTAVFSAVYGSEGENADYSKATPWGELKMNIDNETKAYEAFEAGKDYYLDFTPAN